MNVAGQGEDVEGVIVRQLPSKNAQVCAGRNVGGPPSGFAGSEKHGTEGFPGNAASPAKIACCDDVGAKILEFVSSGTESCASDRKPSKPMNMNVLSFLSANPSVPPNCWRFSESLMGAPCASSENGSPGVSAGANENGSRASIASFRKKPNNPPCVSFDPDLLTILMVAPLPEPRSAP